MYIDMHIHNIYLNHFDVHFKLTIYYKSIILQLNRYIYTYRSESKKQSWSFLQVIYCVTKKIPSNLLKKFLELVSEFSKVRGYEMNIYTSIVLLQNRNENIKTESKNTIPFTIAKKRNAIGVNLTQKKLDTFLANVALSPVICGSG